MQAAALEGVGYFPGVVAGEKHHGGHGGGFHRADFGNGNLKIREHFQQQALELVVGFVHLVDEQYAALFLPERLQEWPGLQELLGEEDVAKLVQAVHGFRKPPGPLEHLVQGFLQHLGVEQLLAIFPFVDGLGFIEPFIALQADQGQLEHLCRGLGQLRLAYAGRAFDEDGFSQVVGQIDGRGDLVAADVTVILEIRFQCFHGCDDLFDVRGCCVGRWFGLRAALRQVSLPMRRSQGRKPFIIAAPHHDIQRGCCCRLRMTRCSTSMWP